MVVSSGRCGARRITWKEIDKNNLRLGKVGTPRERASEETDPTYILNYVDIIVDCRSSFCLRVILKRVMVEWWHNLKHSRPAIAF